VPQGARRAQDASKEDQMTLKNRQQVAQSLVAFHTTLLGVCNDKQLHNVDNLIVKLVADVESVLGIKIRSLADELAANLMR
jgi:hypothetical protein